MLQNNKRNAGQGKNNNNLTKQTNAQKNKSQKETARDGFAKKGMICRRDPLSVSVPSRLRQEYPIPRGKKR